MTSFNNSLLSKLLVVG